ncbi:AarF/ABC1/UbiB kinase family protein [Fulvimarina sp. 2208YS6-2-32]|uniref:AarF/ABC1/UbiB kinase family protein n=1 Tax=Fulvimarina uroteuthidis TaxID=3098149 RepID=A0ABU5I6V4_9HYPH|nr:AarF/ABC1/UbiB kinase family protein [Fulvimarina sp. 2208YS6-2-32]MDY8111097.1 AarF/ABC1/UbiB kinase family protein [Fulvimarina sp. 2208YS6-2-32]
MAARDPFSKGRSVPSGRLSRLARLGGLAGGVAGNMFLDGAGRLARGERPRLSDLLMTPGNVRKVTDQLSQLRGAAMKMGQLISMDAGDLLPPELSEIMGRLRADADPMPGRQLEQVLSRNWGPDWRGRFEYFADRPIAAASIGQVHRALTHDGRDLAIKVQYPGVRQSIDSDIDNVATLLRMTGMIPRELDIAPLLAEAKRQLHEEADYHREAECLVEFRALLKDDPRFVLPAFHADFSSKDVLAMSYIDSAPIESLFTATQAVRDRTASHLIGLVLHELFAFRTMQTDPNLANYRIERDVPKGTERIVLLDFGATRVFPEKIAEACRSLAMAAIGDDRAGAHRALIEMGLLSDAVPMRQHEQILDLFEVAAGLLRRKGDFDFGTDELLASMREEGMKLAEDRQVYLLPPVDTLFLQRKFGGIYLLCLRLKARVDVKALLAPHLPGPAGPA